MSAARQGFMREQLEGLSARRGTYRRPPTAPALRSGRVTLLDKVDRPDAPGGAAAGRPPPLLALHRRPDARRRGPRRPRAERQRASWRRSTSSARRSRTPARRAEITAQYHEVLARIDDEGLDSNISVKLTALGLELDAALCKEQPRGRRRRRAGARQLRPHRHGGLVDDRRHAALYRELRAEGHENVGVVLQAYLRRTIDDIPGLHNVRLCKGIYVEPPEIAYREYESVRSNFVRLPRAAARRTAPTSPSRRTTRS